MKTGWYGSSLAFQQLRKSLGSSQDSLSIEFIEKTKEISQFDKPVHFGPHLPKMHWLGYLEARKSAWAVSRTKELTFWQDRLETHMIAESLGLRSALMLMQVFGHSEELKALYQKTGISELHLIPFRPCGLSSIRNFNIKSYSLGQDSLHDQLSLWIESQKILTGDSFFLIRRSMASMRRLRIIYFRNRDQSISYLDELDCSLSLKGNSVLETSQTRWMNQSSLSKVKVQCSEFLHKVNAYQFGHLDFITDGSRLYFESWHPFATWSTVLSLEPYKKNQSAIHTILEAQISEKITVFSLKNKKIRSQVLVTNREPNLNLVSTGHLKEIISSGSKKSLQESDPSYELDVHQEVHQIKFIDIDSEIELLRLSSEGLPTLKESLRSIQYKLDAWILLGSLESNFAYLRDLLKHPWVKEGMFHEGFLDEEFIPQLLPPARTVAWLKEQIKTTDLYFQLIGANQEGKWIYNSSDQDVACFFFTDSSTSQIVWCNVSGYVLKLKVNHDPLKSTVRELRAHISGKVYSIWSKAGSKIDASRTIVLIENHGELVGHAIGQNGYSIVQFNIQTGDTVHRGQCLAVLTLNV